MKAHKSLLVIIITLIFLNINAQASDNLKWYSFKEGYSKAVNEKKFLLVDFYTDWCHWCKVMDEKTYSKDLIIKELNKNFVLVKLNPEKEGNVNYGGQTYSNADFARAANVSGYPATGFFTRSGDFINTVVGYQDVDKFSLLLKYFLNEHYLKLGFEEFQLFINLENKYEQNRQNADLNFILGYFYDNIFENTIEAKKFYFKSIELSPKYSEVYSSLYHMAKKNNDKAEIDKWQKKANSNKMKSPEEIVEKLKVIIQLYL